MLEDHHTSLDSETANIKKAAKQILDAMRLNFGMDHRFTEVQARSFPHLDKKFYTTIEHQFLREGFSKLGDIEDENLKQSQPNPRTFIRVLSSTDATITAAIYQIKPVFPWPIFCWITGFSPLKVFELETEFTNGRILTTTIAPTKAETDSPAEIMKVYCPKKTTPRQLLQIHQTKVADILRDSKTALRRNNTLQEICDSQNRAFKMMYHYKDAMGWVSKEYLVRQFGKENKMVNAIYDEIQRLVKKEKITGVME